MMLFFSVVQYPIRQQFIVITTDGSSQDSLTKRVMSVIHKGYSDVSNIVQPVKAKRPSPKEASLIANSTTINAANTNGEYNTLYIQRKPRSKN